MTAVEPYLLGATQSVKAPKSDQLICPFLFLADLSLPLRWKVSIPNSEKIKGSVCMLANCVDKGLA